MTKVPEVGVVPGRILHERPRFTAALQSVVPVRLVPLEAAPRRDLSGLIAVGDVPVDEARAGGLPVLGLEVEVEQTLPVRAQGVHLVGASLDATLRGRVLRDDCVDGVRLQGLVSGEPVLAEVTGVPVWVGARDGETYERACLVPRELGPSESIRDLFLEGEFFALLPVLEFLRRIAGEADWTEPRLRATFVIDDPNLRRPTYGRLSFPKLVDHAREHGYHTTIATIPLDSRSVDRGVAALFFDNADVLSLVPHGSSHYGAELRDGIGLHRARQVGCEAMTARRELATRHGLDLMPVMVAPHETFGAESLVALAEAGFHGRCSAIGVRSPSLPTANWCAAEWGGTPLPCIPRRPIGSTYGELALRAYLGQPIVLAGHHDDFQLGLEGISGAVAEVARLGHVEWMSLGRIATSNFATRRHSGLLEVRPYSRSVEVNVPSGVSRLRIEIPTAIAGDQHEVLSVKGAGQTAARLGAGPVEVDVVEGKVNVELQRVPPSSLIRPRRIYGPHVRCRRALTEARDRLSAIG